MPVVDSFGPSVGRRDGPFDDIQGAGIGARVVALVLVLSDRRWSLEERVVPGDEEANGSSRMSRDVEPLVDAAGVGCAADGSEGELTAGFFQHGFVAHGLHRPGMLEAQLNGAAVV